ncbi:30S ribosomal protein S11 [Haloferula chungangensis]|uniref:Small ribosomal subunit protein uS11 n=1 Tax=Haloferula chungangensis TaxID=1048331 RepID=A0ABW2L467_9BACT
MADEETKNETPAAEAPEETAAAAAPAAESTETPKAAEAEKAAEAPKAEEAAVAEGGHKKEEKRDIFAEIAGAEEGQIKIHKAKKSKNVTKGIVHVTATFNNTIVTVTDATGNTIGWSTAGKMGFRGSRKSTAYAAQVVSQDACRQAMGHGLKEAEVRVKGPGSGRESAVRAVQGLGVDILAINDVTSIPHNGCRPKKARRV